MSGTGGRPVVLHVSPHPDDEVLGAGATLLELVAAGWEVVNLACGLGRPAQWERRRGELAASCAVTGFGNLTVDPPVAMSLCDDLIAAQACVEREVSAVLERLRPVVVVSPHENDGHHAHELVGRAVRNALSASSRSTVWWSWGLWADLRPANVYFPFGAETLARAESALAAYEGENARNDYRRLLVGRASANSVLGSERVFGFGSAAASPHPFAELLLERTFDGPHWRVGPPRLLGAEREAARHGSRDTESPPLSAS